MEPSLLKRGYFIPVVSIDICAHLPFTFYTNLSNCNNYVTYFVHLKVRVQATTMKETPCKFIFVTCGSVNVHICRRRPELCGGADQIKVRWQHSDWFKIDGKYSNPVFT